MKKFLKFLLILVAIILIVPIFLPGEVTVERTATVSGSPEAAYGMVADLQKWPTWMPWGKNDPNMTMEFNEVTTGEGAFYSWKSETEGNGKLTISSATPHSALGTSIEFEGMGTSQGNWTFEADGEGTKVTWGMTMEAGYPIGRWFGLFMDGMIGPDFEKGLANIDSILKLEPAAPEYSIEIMEEQVESRPYLSIVDSCMIDSLASVYMNAYGMIGAWMGANEAPMGGMPFSIDHEFDMANGTCVVESCIPTVGEVAGNDVIGSGMTYAGKVLHAIHIGPYTDLPASYAEVMRFMADNGIEANGNSWAVWTSDPGTTPEDELITDLYYPIN